jgi:hypothetical protein
MHTDMKVLVPFKVVLSCKSAKEEVFTLFSGIFAKYLDVIAQGTRAYFEKY